MKYQTSFTEEEGGPNKNSPTERFNDDIDSPTVKFKKDIDFVLEILPGLESKLESVVGESREDLLRQSSDMKSWNIHEWQVVE